MVEIGMPQVVGGEGVVDGRCFDAGVRTAAWRKSRSWEAEKWEDSKENGGLVP